MRPLALSPDGARLFAVNTPDNRLEIFDVGARRPARTRLGARSASSRSRSRRAPTTEVWVVNHLSDSVSIVDVGATPPRVVRTLLVGDEPRDIVFAGAGRHPRLHHHRAPRPEQPASTRELTTPGVGRADVWVFDADEPRARRSAATPLTIVTLFGDTPRALAASPDGSTVYAAVFHSGNQTTTRQRGRGLRRRRGGRAVHRRRRRRCPAACPRRTRNVEGVPRPETGLIVKFDRATATGADELGRNWDNAVRFTLPDQDVFAIDATRQPAGRRPARVRAASARSSSTWR